MGAELVEILLDTNTANSICVLDEMPYFWGGPRLQAPYPRRWALILLWCHRVLVSKATWGLRVQPLVLQMGVLRLGAEGACKAMAEPGLDPISLLDPLPSIVKA